MNGRSLFGRLLLWQSRQPQRFVIVFAAPFLLYLVTSNFARPPLYNNYVLLAYAWLHGHIWIDPPSALIDAVTYGGKYYIIEAPLPAVLMLPAVAFHGLDANQSVVCVAAAATGVAAFDVLLANMNVGAALRLWLVVFLAMGTVYFWSAVNPNV